MNTSQLKRFAQEARRKLLEQVGAKLNFVLTTDSVEMREKTEQLKQLRQELSRTTKEQLIEKVAYTWFNRLMALRFMDVNDYQPLGIRIITPKDGYTIPEILDEAKRGNIPEELKVNRQKIYDLLDGKIPSTNPQNEAFKELLIATCNHLHSTFPFLFEKINDYTELLLPDDLTSDFSIVKDVRDGMLIEDCKNVEIIGWLYQFYISEKKDEVFATKSKVKKDDIPAATQLFTPRWIVEYMVQNSLGKLWLLNHPKSRLIEHMQYYIESASTESQDYLKISSPEEIKLADIACGSGHILVYAFDLFTKIYEEEGYNTSEIPQLIIKNNLYGFEIDERASQLSSLALLMKAREYNRKAIRKDLRPNIKCFSDLRLNSNSILEISKSLGFSFSQELVYDMQQTFQITNLGSLIIPHSKNDEIKTILDLIDSNSSNYDVFQKNNAEKLIESLLQIQMLNDKYHCVVVNPPYMGDSKFNSSLAEYIYSTYPESKLDLMTCFLERSLKQVYSNGYLAMINQHSWMFISSYRKLRKKILESAGLVNMLHLGTRTFNEISGEVVQNTTFVAKNLLNRNNLTTFIRLVGFDSSERKRQAALEAINGKNKNITYHINQEKFNLIPNYNICYWFSDKVISNFKHKSIGSYSTTKAGIVSGNDNDFLKLWFEVSINRITFDAVDFPPENNYVPINKGGSRRKYYGNEEYIINLQNLWKQGRTNKSVRRGDPLYYFKEGITWTMVSGTDFSFRYSRNSTFATAAPAIFFDSTDQTYYCLGLLNSKVVENILYGINPTMNLGSGDVSRLPLNQTGNAKVINELVEQCITDSKIDWETRETFWNFTKNEIIRISGQDMEESYDLYKKYWQKKYLINHRREEEINKHFIEIYGLRNELLPVIPIEEVTLLQNELDRNVTYELNKKLKRNPETHKVTNYDEIELPFIASEIMAQFISYSVGCMFGRYSMDTEGVILANQGETIQNYLNNIGKSTNECSFLPDEDNIIPLLDDEWFEDDIVGRFYHFLKVTFGEKNFNKNLAFIEEQIGKDIRKYFIKDFYSDHIKRYKKRPIYWMFSSPKGSFNVLIYIHRYTPDTVSNILNKYLKEFIGKLNTRKEHLERVKETGSASDKSKAIKESDNIQKMLVELHEYERDILYPLATERIEIDLDDGVLVNYNKFGKAVKEAKGLNDAATKKKVKQFDWIDTTQIR